MRPSGCGDRHSELTTSTIHHYVPQWYQRRFLPSGETRFHLLNMKPWRVVNNRRVPMREVERWGTKKCFQQPDLYSVRVAGYPKDLFEKLFFGDSDTAGASAVEEVSNAGSRTPISREGFNNFFQYLSVQSLRTPKGLAWLRQRLPPSSSKQDLLEHVHRYQYMRCVMWVESFMDVLYHDENVGFLLTDHPITLYNKACFPRSSDCVFPNDPGAAWKGTQTIFPLDSKKCFVLTHTEYAHNQKMKSQLTRPRTNARLFGNTMAKTHQIVHRQVSRDAVIQINRILKWRATRYIAAPTYEWLFPEEHCAKVQWPDLGAHLLPTTDLWRNTGEILMGLPDGSVYAQDQYGRSPRTAAEQAAAEATAKRLLDQMERIKKNEGKTD